MPGDAAFEKLFEQCARARSQASKLRQESRALIQRLHESMQALEETTLHTRQTVRALKNGCRVQPSALHGEKQTAEPSTFPDAGVPNILAGMSDVDLDQLADRLIDAHDVAKMQGDEALRRLIEKALYQIGYALAARVGPKASGVVLN